MVWQGLGMPRGLPRGGFTYARPPYPPLEIQGLTTRCCGWSCVAFPLFSGELIDQGSRAPQPCVKYP